MGYDRLESESRDAHAKFARQRTHDVAVAANSPTERGQWWPPVGPRILDQIQIIALARTHGVTSMGAQALVQVWGTSANQAGEQIWEACMANAAKIIICSCSDTPQKVIGQRSVESRKERANLSGGVGR